MHSTQHCACGIQLKKETIMSGVIVFALEMGVVAIIALAIYMVVKK
jgi:hypothetical protein